nr:ATP-binding protein [Variovorax sp. S12S4]
MALAAISLAKVWASDGSHCNKNGGRSVQQEDIFYENRFLESWAGSIITNPSTAIVELVANCWDAYATKVDISWPDSKKNKQFSISDNGKGMTKAEFDYIWRAMSYDRIAKTGLTAAPPPGVEGLPRFVFGKNGKGRFASFCLTKNYVVTSVKDGQRSSTRSAARPTSPSSLNSWSSLRRVLKGMARRSQAKAKSVRPTSRLNRPESSLVVGSLLTRPSRSA